MLCTVKNIENFVGDIFEKMIIKNVMQIFVTCLTVFNKLTKIFQSFA